ncbi:MAG: BON domain-containing protein [Gammaproteobacteria bacterium]|nr:BON domain-containing protein [Gammaproteobacteria bacterium]
MNTRAAWAPRALALALMVGALTGCVGVMLGGAAGGASVVNDPRTTGSQVEDESIEIKAGNLIRGDGELNQQSHINVTSYNQVVLVTGETPTEDMRTRLIEMVKGIEKVRTVHNEVTIGAPSPVSARSKDSWLTTNVKGRIVGAKELSAIKFKVVTEAATVYLLGMVTQAEGTLAAQLASQTPGVLRVVKLFEYQ